MSKILLDDLISEGETIEGYVTSSDYYSYNYCIAMESRDDLGNEIDGTLHRLIDAGADEECVRQWLGLCKHDDPSDEEEFIDIDLGYVLPGNLMHCEFMTVEWKAYISYRNQWLAAHGIQASVYSCLNLENPFSRLHEACKGLFGETWAMFDEFAYNLKRGFAQNIPYNTEDIIVGTPKGEIVAKVIPDQEYPGISLEYVNEDGCPGAIMEYSPKIGEIQLRVYGKSDPNGDPIEIYQMS